MGREAGPTISVSTSGFYITGNSSDATSGIAKYCYNTSDTPGEYTDVPAITVGAYSVPQYHVQATGTYRCHVLDTAGNYGRGSSSYITYYTYHCNYCGQNTNSITNHYRCPTHFASQSCSTYTTCTLTGACGGTIVISSSSSGTQKTYQLKGTKTGFTGNVKCDVCNNYISGSFYYRYNGDNFTLYKCGTCGHGYQNTVTGSGGVHTITRNLLWCLDHRRNAKLY